MNGIPEINREIRWSIVVSILMILVGCVAILVPPISGIAVTLFVAWLMILAGVAHWVYTWHRRHRPGMWWGWLMGLLFIGVGICMLAFPLAALASLTLVLGAYLIVEAVLEFTLAFRLRPRDGWGWLFFDGLVALVLGFIIFVRWPHSALWVIGTLIGISIFCSGVTRFMMSLAARDAAKGLEQPTPAH
jgi:uncharacterized membrane protein HdeD (DUF308 family)